MSQFAAFVESLVPSLRQGKDMEIKGKQRSPKGAVKLGTINMPENPYIKVTFIDGSFLLIMLADQELYFAESIVDQIKEISDDQIGKEKLIHYNGKDYELGNKDDYQFVIERYLGNFYDIEGEARFSDYFPIKGTKEFLSLGWLSYTQKRADINPVLIGLNEIKLI